MCIRDSPEVKDYAETVNAIGGTGGGTGGTGGGTVGTGGSVC